MAIVGRTVSIVVSIVALTFLVLAPAVSAADPGADLSLTMTVDVPDPEIGQQVTFTLTVSNTGTDDATLVEVTDLLPAGLVFESISNGVGFYNSTTGVWDASPLIAGDTRELNIVATVTSATPVENYAEVTAVTPESDPDSTPDNGSTTEDDDATASVTPRTPPDTIIVNSAADPGDGVANATETTLREAIAVAEAGSEDRIQFAIGAGATQTITLNPASGPLEPIDNRIVIDGTTEGPGASGRVAIDGSSLTLANADGMTILGGSSTIRGLAVISFPRHGIVIGGRGSNVIADNYIGLGLDGLTAAGNGQDGIRIADTLGSPIGVNNTVGGTHPTDGNLIAGNGNYGIQLMGDGFNVVRGNYVGLNASGIEARPNALGGILIRSSNNDIGGTTGFEDCAPCNVISGNGAAGISVSEDNNVIHGNFIGTNAAGGGDVPNLGDGIVVGGPLLTTSGTVIGNEPPGLARNVISGNDGHGILVVGTGTTMTRIAKNNIGATLLGLSGFNGGDGIHIAGADTTTIESNLIMDSGGDGVAVEGPGNPRAFLNGFNVIFSNTDLGIDLNADGVTPNDPDANNDADTGPDGLQNFPDLVSAVATNMPTLPGNTITIDFSLQTIANRTGIVVDFFESTSCNPGAPNSPPFGEGFTNIGSVTVDTDADGENPATGTASVEFTRFVPPGFVITATATGSDGTSEFSRCITVVEADVPSADLSLTKTVDDPTPTVGDTVAFTLTLSNAGPDSATNVTLTDLLPAGLTFVSASPSQGSYASAIGLWTVGSVAASGSVTLDIRARVTTAGSLTNAAEVTTSDQFDPDSTPNNNSQTEDDEDQATVLAGALTADLSLTKTVDDPSPTVGDTVAFTLTLSNAGPDSATNVTLTDLLPAGLTFVSASPSQGSYASAIGLWTVGSVAASGSVTLDIRARVTTAGSLTNAAEVTTSDQFDPDSTPNNNSQTEDDEDQATVLAGALTADLSLTKTVDDPSPTVGDTVAFTLTLSNAGPDSATNVTLTDLLPAGLTFVSASPSQGSYASAIGLWTVGSVAASGSVTLDIRARVTTAGSLTNAAEVTTSDQFDPDSTPNNNSQTEDDEDQATVLAGALTADLSLTKTASDTTPDIGVDFNFTLTVANAAGGIDATGVAVRDLLPSQLRFVSATPSLGTYNATTGVWTVGTVTSGANATLVLTVKHIGGSAAQVTNAAEITAADQADPDSTPNNNSTNEDDDAALSVTPTQPVCAGRNATIIGTIDNDNLAGTQGPDVIVLFSGNDAFNGRKGDDAICGGDGSDTLQGDQGLDIILGEDGTDVLNGGQDADTVDGGAGDNDRVEGGNDTDTIGGGAGTGDFCGGNGGTNAFIGGSQAASGCETVSQIP